MLDQVYIKYHKHDNCSKYKFVFDEPCIVTNLVYYAPQVFEPSGYLYRYPNDGVRELSLQPDMTLVAYTNQPLYSNINFTVTTPYVTLKYGTTLTVYDEFSQIYTGQTPIINTKDIKADEYIIYSNILPENTITSLIRYLKIKWEA